MKNVYSVSKPAWSGLDRLETGIITTVVVAVAIYAGWGRHIAIVLLAPIHLQGYVSDRSWPIIDALFTAAACLILIRIYQQFRIGRYPSTFLYCFTMPSASNPDGMSRVVGYCSILPDMEGGRLTVKGASFFWANRRLAVDSRVGFCSTHVWATKDESDNVCYITYSINESDKNTGY